MMIDIKEIKKRATDYVIRVNSEEEYFKLIPILNLVVVNGSFWNESHAGPMREKEEYRFISVEGAGSWLKDDNIDNRTIIEAREFFEDSTNQYPIF